MGRVRACTDPNAPLTDPDRVRQAISEAHELTMRTARELKTLVLVGPDCTQVEKLSPGKADPLLQLTLLARDQWMQAQDENIKLGYFREMRAIFTNVDEKTAAAITELSRNLEKQAEMSQRDRHHGEKLELMRLKAGNEPTDAELEDASGQ